MESRIVELRERTRDTVQRGRKALLIAAGVGAAVGAAAVTAFVLYRVSRPATPAERFQRVVPEAWLDWIRHGREKVELTLRRGIPTMRLYVGDRQVGEQPPSTSVERLVIKAAQAAGTAVGAALVSRAFAQIQKRGKAG